MEPNQLQSIRRAMRALLDTHTGTSKEAQEARSAATAAYRGAFTVKEKIMVLREAQRRQRDARDGHFLRQLPEITTYAGALEVFGNSLLNEVLGSAA